MTLEDPPRLLEGALDPALRDALGQATREAPTPEQLGQLADRVAGALAPSSGLLAGTWVKLTLGVLALGGGLYASQPRSLLRERATQSATVVQAPSSEPPVAAPVPEAAVVVPAAARVAPPTASEESASRRERRRPRATRPRERLEARAPLVQDVPEIQEPSHEPPRVVATAEPLPSELSLLQQARRALRTAPRRALSLAARHRELYPNGDFAEERDVTTLEALARLHDDSLRARAAEFLQRHPSSLHSQQVRRLLDRF